MPNNSDRLHLLLSPVILALGYSLWGIQFIQQKRALILRVYIDKKEGVLLVDDCAIVSRHISSLLDVEDIIPNQYTLEVSSPGIERPLFNIEQYSQYIGKGIRLRLHSSFEGNRNMQGVIKAIEGDSVVIHTLDSDLSFPISGVEKANLIFS